MAITWGSWVNDGSNGMRVGLELTQSPSSVGASTSSVSITARSYVETRYSVYDSTNTARLSGDMSWSGSVNISHGGSGGTTLMRTQSLTVATSYTSTKRTDVSASLTGIAAVSGTASVSASITTAKRAYSVPAAPASPSVSLSGSSATVRWTRKATTAAPWDNVEIERSVNGGSYADVATVSGGTTSWTNTGLGANVKVQYRVRSKNSAGASGWAYTGAVTTAPNSPAPVTGLGVSRSSDTRQVLSWANHPSSSAPYTSVAVDRWDNVSNAWKNIANTSGSATSYTDSATSANRKYQYRVAPKNAAGYASRVYSAFISTTPAPPTSLKATKKGADVSLSWAGVPPQATGVEVWHGANGVRDGSRLTLLSGRPTSYVHTAPDATKTHTYWLKSVGGGDAAPTLYSAFSAASNVVQLLTPPAAPTRISPTATAMDVATSALSLTWQHNTIDSTDQTAYEVQWRVDGAAWSTTGKVVSTAAQYTFAPIFSNGSLFEAQVRTWGDHATAGPWSSAWLIAFSGAPGVQITAPGDTLYGASLVLAWDYFDPEATTQTGYRVRVGDEAGNNIHAFVGAGDASTYTVPVAMQDGITYTVFLQVKDGAGLWSEEVSQAFTVEYPLPPAPVVSAHWDIDTGTVALITEVPEPGPTEGITTSLTVRRAANGEEWVTLYEGLDPAPDAAVVDMIPPLATTVYYQVEAHSDLGASAPSDVVEVVTDNEGWIYVNGGPGFGQMAKIRDNANSTYTRSRAKTRNQFLGRSYPVETRGTARGLKVSLAADISDDSSTLYEWWDVLDAMPPLCYRDSTLKAFVSADDASSTYQQIDRDISVSFEGVDHRE